MFYSVLNATVSLDSLHIITSTSTATAYVQTSSANNTTDATTALTTTYSSTAATRSYTTQFVVQVMFFSMIEIVFFCIQIGLLLKSLADTEVGIRGHDERGSAIV